MVRGTKRKKEETDEEQVGDANNGNKQSKKRTAPTNTSLLPPCKICREPGAGFHYGANTCEACKGFFRRTLMREGDYVCVNRDERCTVIQAELRGRKRICSRCRHLKCLAVGMSLDAVKTGRYTHAKRTQDILEYKQTVEKNEKGTTDSSPSSTTSTQMTAINSTSTAATSSSSATSTPVFNSKSPPLTSSFSASTTPTTFSDSLSAHTDTTPSSVDTYDLSPSSIPSIPFPSPDCDSTSEYTTLKPISFSSLRGDTLSPQSLGGTSISSESDRSQSSTPPFFPSCMMGRVINRIIGNELDRNEGRVFTSVKESEVCSSGVTSSLGESGLHRGDMSEAECEEMTGFILKSFSDCAFVSSTMSAEEILEKQKACHEDRQARIEAFGPMGNLSEEEYQSVYRSTGIDVDNRQAFLSTVTRAVAAGIKEYIKFAKTIPGFSALCMNDKIRLLRDNRFEVMLVGQSRGYHHEYKVFVLPSGRTFTSDDLEKLGGKERQSQRYECLHTLQKLGLNEEEKVLFVCVILFTAGWNDLDEPERVSEAQWRMMQCWRWLLKRNRQSGVDMLVARAMALFGRMRELSKVFREWFKSRPFAHYAQFRQNEFLAEWFSNS